MKNTLILTSMSGIAYCKYATLSSTVKIGYSISFSAQKVSQNEIKKQKHLDSLNAFLITLYSTSYYENYSGILNRVQSS